MLNELLYAFAEWLDTFAWSTGLHESYYMYPWGFTGLGKNQPA